MNARLSNATWSHLYDRTSLQPGVVHLGLGAFHRAHQAPVFDTLAAAGDRRWGIVGVAMRSPGVVTALAAQDGLYGLMERGPGGAAVPRVIGAITELLIATRDERAVVSSIAAAGTRLVTITVTEKGYLDHSSHGPAGLIARALERRRGLGLAPITVMSCDNRASNGPFTRDAVLAAAARAEVPDVGLRWIAETVAFPSTMVDRITPAATSATLEQASAALGLVDKAAVCTEPFWQWVVEDHFAADRPDLSGAGVQVVTAVEPWEQAKLRLLNAAHSALAYGGLLRGHRYVHQAIADMELNRLVNDLWSEAAETIDAGIVNVPAYRSALLDRFANVELHHGLIQIAADGSQKLPPRILSGMAERRGRGLSSPAMAMVAAMWMHVLPRIDGLTDPILSDLQAVALQSRPVDALLALIGAPVGLAVEIAPQLTELRDQSTSGGL